ncbi:MAG: VOC family protein [Cytophagia bacterium]|nr:VOC family protein [Cytophagia bacterium]
MKIDLKIASILLAFFLVACGTDKQKTLAAFEVYCEMVSNTAKPLALSPIFEPEEADALELEFFSIADSLGLKIFREDHFPVTALYDGAYTDGKTIFGIYKDEARKFQYDLLKFDIEAGNGTPIELGRRMGRLLGYSPQGINELLMANSDFKAYSSLDVQEQITHLYYENVERALSFYAETLGLTKVGENRFQIGVDALIQINPVSDEYPADLPKSTAIALLTDQLPEWYEYVQQKGIEIKYTYKPRDGGPHDGFVAIDPEGYLLEFEQFKQHPENELFVAALASAPKLATGIDGLSFYGSITWTYHEDLLAQQNFYDEVMGFQMVADQGWTKIYQTSWSGFIGLVDERRGMEDYADQKGVKLEWRIKEEIDGANLKSSFFGPEKYQYVFKK